MEVHLKNTIKEIKNLYNNGNIIYQLENPEGAIVSFSSCASMIRVVLKNDIIDNVCDYHLGQLNNNEPKLEGGAPSKDLWRALARREAGTIIDKGDSSVERRKDKVANQKKVIVLEYLSLMMKFVIKQIN